MAFQHRSIFSFTPLTTIEQDGIRHYNIPNGERYPSVTTVLGYAAKERLQEWRDKVGEEQANKIMNDAAYRGTKVHDMSERLLKNEDIDYSHENPFAVSLFIPLRNWFQHNITEVWALEQPVYSHKLRVAGRTDIVAKTLDGHARIIDIKTSTVQKKREWITNYFMQCAAYAYCIKELSGVSINRFSICIVNETNGTLDVHEGVCSDYVVDFYKLRKKYDEETTNLASVASNTQSS